jgi:hypothetical protein
VYVKGVKMAVNLNQIVNDVLNYVKTHGGQYSQWYAGIASKPRNRLFDDHRVDERGVWIYSDCEGSVEARRIENHLLGLGFDGGDGGGSYDTRFLYAYKKTLSSNP